MDLSTNVEFFESRTKKLPRTLPSKEKAPTITKNNSIKKNINSILQMYGNQWNNFL